MTRLRTYNQRKKRRLFRAHRAGFVGYREANPLNDIIKMEQRRLLEFSQRRVEEIAWGESTSSPLADIQRMRELTERRTYGPGLPHRVLSRAEFTALKKEVERLDRKT